MSNEKLEDRRCTLCGEFHDVEDETAYSGTGHSYVQAQRIYECDKAQYPDEEALQD